MTLPVPDMSPKMLRQFVKLRCELRQRVHGESEARAVATVSRIIRRDAGVTLQHFDAALAGKADAATLAKVWRGLGVEIC